MAVVVVAPFAPRGPAYAATSVSEQAIVPSGLIDFIVQPNLAYTPGMRVRMSATASDSWMEGTVKTYVGVTLSVEINLSNGGGGPYKSWNINLAGEPGIVPSYAGTATNALISVSRFSATEPSSITFRLNTLAGTEPTDADVVRVLFPNGSLRLISDDLVYTTIANATSLGTINGAPFRVWILLIDDIESGGKIKLGAIQTRTAADNSIKSLPADGLIPPSMFPEEGFTALAGQVYMIYGAIPPVLTTPPTVPLPYIVLGFADFDVGQTTAGSWNLLPDRVVMFGPGIKLPGQELQTVGIQYGSYVSLTDVTIPYDNTAPQVSEGANVMAQSVVARCVQSVFEVEAQIMYAATAGVTIGAMFRSTNATAIATTWAEKFQDQLFLWSKVYAFTPASTNFSVRIGSSVAPNMLYINGGSSGGFFGGTGNSYLRITERQT